MSIFEKFNEEELKRIDEMLPFPKKWQEIKETTKQEECVYIDKIFWLSDFINVDHWMKSCLDALVQIRFGLLLAIYYYDHQFEQTTGPILKGFSGRPPNIWLFNYFIDNCFYRVQTFYERIGQLLNEHFKLGLKQKDVTFKGTIDLLRQDPSTEPLKVIETLDEIKNRECFSDFKEYRNSLTHRREPKYKGPLAKTNTSEKGHEIVLYYQSTKFENEFLKTLCTELYKSSCEAADAIMEFLDPQFY